MPTRQYIGARYVPKIFEHNGSNEWISGIAYEPLTIVTYLNNSYTSKQLVPSSVGNPADNGAYWANTGNYNAQIEQYREFTEQSIVNLTEYVENRFDNIEETFFIVGANAEYHTISDAYDACVDNGGGTIVITEGTYDEYIVGGNVTVPITFIGTDRNKSVWVSSTGGYDYACFTGTGNLTFENLTMYKKIPATQTTQGGYALHMDYPDATGNMYVHNCNLISEENAAIGCGTGTNQKITIEDCYIEFNNVNSIRNTNGALLYHTSGTSGHTGQSFKLRNCLIKSSSVIGNILNSENNTENVPLEVLNNYFYSTASEFQPNKSTWEASFGFTDVTANSHFSYTESEFGGNNLDKLNYNKFTNPYNRMVKQISGLGFDLTGTLLDFEPVNCFFNISSAGTEKPIPEVNNHYFGFVYGYDKNNKVAIATNYSNGRTYKKRIRNGAVVQDWTEINFGEV